MATRMEVSLSWQPIMLTTMVLAAVLLAPQAVSAARPEPAAFNPDEIRPGVLFNVTIAPISNEHLDDNGLTPEGRKLATDCAYAKTSIGQRWTVQSKVDWYSLYYPEYYYTHTLINYCNYPLTFMYILNCLGWESIYQKYPKGNLGPKGNIIQVTDYRGGDICRLNYGGADGNTQIPAKSTINFGYVSKAPFSFCNQHLKWKLPTTTKTFYTSADYCYEVP